MNMQKELFTESLDLEKGSAFERAESIRYENLRKAPKDLGPAYGELNFDGCTIEEILGLAV